MYVHSLSEHPIDEVDHTLVLGAGLGTTSASLWREVLPLLPPSIQVYGADLPGHGLAPAASVPPDVSELGDSLRDAVLAALESDGLSSSHSVSFAGVSLAGAIGLDIAARHADVFSSVGVFCSAPIVGVPSAWSARSESVLINGMDAVATSSPSRWFTEQFRASRPEVVESFVREAKTVDAVSYASLCHTLANFDYRDRISDLCARVLCVSGAEDAVTPADSWRGLHLPTDSLFARVLVPDVAHQAPIEDPISTAFLLSALCGPVGVSASLANTERLRLRHQSPATGTKVHP